MTVPAKPFILCDNVLELGIPIATDTETAYDALNLIDWRNYTFWQSESLGTKYVTIDCGSGKPVNTFAVVGHNFFTASATISLESSTNNVNWTERVAGFTVTSNDAFAKIFVSATAQYWRIKIVSASIAVRMAILVIGTRLDFETGLQRDIDPNQQGISAESKVSELGYPLGTSIKFYPRNFSCQIKNLSDSWSTNTFYPIWISHLSKMIPFIWGWEITGHPTEVYLMRLKDNHKLDMPFQGIRRSLKLDLVGVRE